MEKLGMDDTCKHQGEWINPCSNMSDEIYDDSSEDSDSELEVENTHENKIEDKKYSANV